MPEPRARFEREEELRERAAALDASDALAWTRSHFAAPESGLVYLDGNSLGRAPLRSREDLVAAWEDQWATGLVRSWDSWFDLPTELGDVVATVIGAPSGTTVVADSTSVHLYKAMHAAISSRPGRSEVVAFSSDFPTNRFIVEGVAEQRGLAVRWLDQPPAAATGPAWDAFESACGPQVAVVCCSLADYRTAAVCAGPQMAEAASTAGAALVWDLCHSAGAVDVDVSRLRAMFAVGCTYKYLCGGPGSPGFIHCAEGADLDGLNPIRGWWSAADQFSMELPYQAQPGPRGYLTGSPPVLGLVAARAGVELAATCGSTALAAKAGALTDFLIEAADAVIEDAALSVRSPRDAAGRTGHVAFGHPGAWQLCQALATAGVIGDFRDPDILRLAAAPLTTSFAEVLAGVLALAEILGSGSWSAVPETRSRIT